MRKAYLVFAVFVLFITACAAEPAPTDVPLPAATDAPLPAATAVTPTHLVNLTAAEHAAIERLAENFNLPTQDITLLSAEEEEWPDGCLGVAQEGLVCTQAITPGYRILLEADGRQVEYRTNEDGTQVRPATVIMTWKREGGIAGFCDVLTVYLSGEVQASSCNTNESVEVLLGEVLPTTEMIKLEEWVAEYGNVSIEQADPETTADRMVVTLELMGLGGSETISAVNEQQLLDFAQSLHQAVYNR